VLSSPNPFPDQPQLRYRCRNPRCRLGLKVPASAAIDAFCTRGCYTGFFHKRCRVCERSFDRRNNRQQVCDRRKCRNAFRADRARFFSTTRTLPTARRNLASISSPPMARSNLS
jgi:hypothetical protein